MTNTRSNLAHRFCARPERTFLFTALIGATAAAGILGCGPRPDSPERANTSALSAPVGAPPFRDGVYVPINRNAWIMRVGDTGMPQWFKSLRSVGFDILQGIVPLADGLVAFGSTSSLRTATQPGTDTWLARTNVDGMLDFTGTGGFDAVNDVVGWESTIGIVSVPLAPIATTPALPSSAALFDQVTVSATTELLTQ